MDTKILVVLILTAILIVSCGKGDDGKPQVTSKITMTTAKSAGSTIKLKIEAESPNQGNCWIDLNNNGSKDSGEEITKFGTSENQEYQILGQTVSIYGPITNLVCDFNRITKLDISQNSNLTALYCFNNELENLDLSTNVNLETLDCSDNPLESLDLSKNVNLTALYCHDNALENLDLNKNVNLTTLYCQNNTLKNLDLSKNKAITYIFCNANSLEDLDVSNNVNLKTLRCEQNRLKNLDVSKNTSLNYLYCKNNSLTTLNIANGNNADFETVEAAGNATLTCIQIDKGFVVTSDWKKDDAAIWNNSGNPCE